MKSTLIAIAVCLILCASCKVTDLDIKVGSATSDSADAVEAVEAK